ncbi:hypothetical protein PFISCL1PPCAC_21786, partial [Pristionchus fissidentatus]
TLQELTKIEDQLEVVKETPKNLDFAKEECYEPLDLINNASTLLVTIPLIDMPTPIQQYSIPQDHKDELIDPVVKDEEEDPFGFMHDILNYSANDIKHEKTDPIPEGKDENEMHPIDEEEEKDEEELDVGDETEENGPQAKKIKRDRKNGATREMECPKCTNYRSKSVFAVDIHFRRVHGTSPSNAGFMFLCDCGDKSPTTIHYIKNECALLNFKLIHEERAMCFLCEARPKSCNAYTRHLYQKHHTSLRKNGFHLLCSCGVRIDNDQEAGYHKKGCGSRQFTVHKT